MQSTVVNMDGRVFRFILNLHVGETARLRGILGKIPGN